MKINLLTKRVIGVVFGLSLLLGIGMTPSSEARAQWQDPYWQQREQIRRQREWEREQRRRQREARRDDRYRDDRYDDRYRNDRYGRNGRYDDGYGYYGGSYQLRQTALNAGYNEGMKAGRDDRNHNRRFEFRDESAYQKASKDYNSRMGDRGLYQTYFRQAFQTGYNDGYRGY